jgi:hypothetical protein
MHTWLISPSRGLRRRLFCLGLACLILQVTSVATGATVTWPTGPAPCNDINDLETCILTGIAPGDVVEIAANAIPGQGVTVLPGKSFTLRPSPGYTPVFASFFTIAAFGADTDITVVIEGITIEAGRIILRQGGEGTFNVTARDNVIQQTATYGSAIGIDSANTQPPYGPTLFLVESNQISINLDPDDAVSAISAGGFQGGGNVGSIVGNVINQIGGDQNAAISLSNGNVSLSVDVLGNQITGTNFNSGVSLYQYADGSLSARVVNNTISGQVSTAGAPAGISLNVSEGDGSFTVVNNSVAYNERGVLVNGRSDLGATISGTLANNIIAFNTSGVSIDGDFESTFSNGYNLVSGNGGDSFTPGVGTVTEDPLFVSASDFHGQPASPARNAGSNAQVPGDITTDVAGNPRIREGTVDIGAYEDQGSLIPGIPALSGWGLLVLALAVFLGGAAVLRLRMS